MNEAKTVLAPIAGDLTTYPVYKISEKDTNKFALLCDTTTDALPFMMCIEIFDVGGATPVNRHEAAFEHFYVLSGSGIAKVGDEEIVLCPGAHLIVPMQTDHVVQNTGSSKLYVLTTMVPDENFCSLIHSGIEVSLDDEDIRVLKGIAW